MILSNITKNESYAYYNAYIENSFCHILIFCIMMYKKHKKYITY